MNEKEILKKIYSLIDIHKIIDIFFEELLKIFPFDSCGFFRLLDQKNISILSLVLPKEYQNLKNTLQNMTFKLEEAPYFQKILVNKHFISIHQEEIAKETNVFKKRLHFLEIEKPLQEALIFPIKKENAEIIGFIVCNSYTQNISPKIRSTIQKLISLFQPIFANTLFVRDIIEKQKNIEKLANRYQRILKFIIDFNQLIELETYFEKMIQELNKTFGFELGLVQFEKNGKLPVIYGSGINEEFQAIFEKERDYFSYEKNAPLISTPNGPEAASCFTLLNNTRYYVEDASIFYKKEIKLLPKDKIALEIMGRPIKSFIQMAIVDQNKPIGVLQLWSFSHITSLSQLDIEIISSLCAFVPSILKNYALHSEIEKKNQIISAKNKQLLEEIKLAQKIQMNLIPQEFPHAKQVRFAFFYKPMENVGGDFYDFLKIREPNTFGIFISDVSGHGVPAAFITTMLKTLNATSGKHKLIPQEMLVYLNNNLFHFTSGNFITAFYGVYDCSSLTFSYCNAGHNPPLLLREKQILPLEAKGKILGVFQDISFEEKSIELKKHDRLIFYTDGIVETFNPEGKDFEEKFLDILIQKRELSAEELIQTIYYELLFHKGDHTFDDDLCLICMDILE